MIGVVLVIMNLAVTNLLTGNLKVIALLLIMRLCMYIRMYLRANS